MPHFSLQLWEFVQAPLKNATDKLGGQIIAIDPMEMFSIIWMWTLWWSRSFWPRPGWFTRSGRLSLRACIRANADGPCRSWCAPAVCSSPADCSRTSSRFGIALVFLLGIGAARGVKPYITIDRYFGLFVNVMLGISLVFELPVIIFFLTLIRVASPSFLLRNSRYAILAIVILAAVITPTPDVFNLTLFAVPMILLYFMGVFASYLLVMRRENRRFPWRIFLYWLLAVLPVLAASFSWRW